MQSFQSSSENASIIHHCASIAAFNFTTFFPTTGEPPSHSWLISSYAIHSQLPIKSFLETKSGKGDTAEEPVASASKALEVLLRKWHRGGSRGPVLAAAVGAGRGVRQWWKERRPPGPGRRIWLKFGIPHQLRQAEKGRADILCYNMKCNHCFFLTMQKWMPLSF